MVDHKLKVDTAGDLGSFQIDSAEITGNTEGRMCAIAGQAFDLKLSLTVGQNESNDP
jgi:hypothetical protein